MKILLINPNTSQHVTERMRANAQQAVGDAATVHAFTAQSGPAIISSRSENAIALAEMLRLAAAHQEGHDVLMLGVSIDTGLQALREMLDIPVVGMAEAALLTASMLGGKIGCLTLGAAMVPAYEELTASYGLASRVSKWRAVEVPSAFKATDADPEVERACEALQVVEDLIIAAIRDAQANAAARSQQEMSKLAASMGLPPDLKLPF